MLVVFWVLCLTPLPHDFYSFQRKLRVWSWNSLSPPNVPDTPKLFSICFLSVLSSRFRKELQHVWKVAASFWNSRHLLLLTSCISHLFLYRRSLTSSSAGKDFPAHPPGPASPTHLSRWRLRVHVPVRALGTSLLRLQCWLHWGPTVPYSSRSWPLGSWFVRMFSQVHLLSFHAGFLWASGVCFLLRSWDLGRHLVLTSQYIDVWECGGVGMSISPSLCHS